MTDSPVFDVVRCEHSFSSSFTMATPSIPKYNFSSLNTPLSDSFLSFPGSSSARLDFCKDSDSSNIGTPNRLEPSSSTFVQRHPRTFGRINNSSSSSSRTPGFSYCRGTSRSSSASYHPLTTPSSHGGSTERTSGRTPASVSTPAAAMPSAVVAYVTMTFGSYRRR